MIFRCFKPVMTGAVVLTLSACASVQPTADSSLSVHSLSGKKGFTLFGYSNRMASHVDMLKTVELAQQNYVALPYAEHLAPALVGRFPGQHNPKLSDYFEFARQHNPVEIGTIAMIDESQPEDIWERVRSGFGLPHQSHKRIDSNIRWFANNQKYLDRVSERAERYLHLIIEEVEKRGMPSEIALLPVVESAFQPFAYSHGRAAGIWQFIPSTGRLFGLKQNWWYDGRRDVMASTHAALNLLENLHRRFDNDWLLALAAYNSGSGTVSRAIRKNKRKGLPTDFWSLDLPAETEGYVPKLIAIATLVENPADFDIALNPIPNEPYMTGVNVESQIDLALAAELAGISLEELYLLNPGFNRWATDPSGPHEIMVPVANAEGFADNLTGLPRTERLRWERHEIRKGETLLQIAERYNTTVGSIKEVNQIRGNTIRAGKNLVVPVSSKASSSYTLSADQRLTKLQNIKRDGRGERVTYRVRKGDTLWDISRRFGVNHRALAKWNGLAPRDTLSAGRKLVIWSKRTSQVKAQFSPHERSVITQKIRYRVRQGDSFARIADKFNIRINDLLRWNGISSKKILQPGQNLTLYIDVTQQTGT